jgi:hypothetical protein
MMLLNSNIKYVCQRGNPDVRVGFDPSGDVRCLEVSGKNRFARLFFFDEEPELSQWGTYEQKTIVNSSEAGSPGTITRGHYSSVVKPSVFSEEGLSEECKTELGIHKPRFAQLRTFENLAASLQNVLLHLP